MNARPELQAMGQRSDALSRRRAAVSGNAANRTGLPDKLKSGLEALSGVSLDGVRVHRNSAQPAKVNALATARGAQIHLGPGQEKHLAHEAWHAVQQAQGRVRANRRMKGVGVNDDAGLEREADRMGAVAARGALTEPQSQVAPVEGPTALQRTVSMYEGLLEEASGALGFDLDEVAIVEVPNGTYLFKPFSDFGGQHLRNLPAGLAAMSVGSLQGCNEADYEADALAEHELSRLGGASYMHAHNLFIYLESGLDRRTIFHELGHHVQNKAGVNSDVASQSLLEFHNILMHENKADPFTSRFRNHYVDKGRAALGDVAQSINALANLPGPWPKQADDGLRGMIVGELRRLAAIPATPDEDYSSFIVNFVANLIADIARERKAAAPAGP